MSKKYEASEEVKEFIKDAVGFIYANSFEKSILWRMHSDKAGKLGFDGPKFSWEEVLFGYGASINGETFISILKAKINGRTIVFIDPTSLKVDWAEVRRWIVDVAPDSARDEDGRVHITDAEGLARLARG